MRLNFSILCCQHDHRLFSDKYTFAFKCYSLLNQIEDGVPLFSQQNYALFRSTESAKRARVYWQFF